MADFLEYMQSEGLAKRQAIAANASALTDALIQAKKNASAPVVSGGGGTISSQAANLGPLPTMGGKVMPVAGARISQEWGKSNIKYAAGRHTGMDFAAKTGTNVRSVAGGIVKRTGYDKAYGNYMAVGHKDGTTSFYAHLSSVNAKAGQKVKSGQNIGKVGNTGRSFGSHLHFEVRKSDKYGGDINPRSWYSSR